MKLTKVKDNVIHVVTAYLGMGSLNRSVVNYGFRNWVSALFVLMMCYLKDALVNYPKLIPLWIMIIVTGVSAGYYVIPATACLVLLVIIHWFYGVEQLIWTMWMNKIRYEHEMMMSVIRGYKATDTKVVDEIKKFEDF